ncbi:MAG: class I SAM-dependent methyltransferase [Patescibacteria group bacterium]
MYTINNLNELLSTVGDMALKRRAKRIVEELQLKNMEKILDVGCGNGYYLNLLNKLGFELILVGIDNDGRALKDARKLIRDNKVKLISANANKLPLESRSFDKVILSEVIEHVEDEQKVLSEIYRVLKPGGVMVLTTCNKDYPFLWDPVNFCLQHFFNTHIKSGFWAGIWNQHLRLYKINPLNALIKKTKFKIEVSEFLTRWCLPFNHYLVNYVARLFYQGVLPKAISKGLNKFEKEKGLVPVRMIFWLINTYDKLNDLLPGKNGVSIFIKARK